MRFFAHDGKTTHGPAPVDELLKLPGFDGDTLVCPVGAANSEDWKPALAYPPFKRAMLSPKAPAPTLPEPAPRIKTTTAVPMSAVPTPCPRCAHQNPEEAHYCNACGASLDAKREVESVPALMPAEVPMSAVPTTAVPMSAVPTPLFVRTRPAWKRPAALAAFVLAAIVASGLAWMMRAPTTTVPMSAIPTPLPETTADLAPSAPMPMPAPATNAPVNEGPEVAYGDSADAGSPVPPAPVVKPNLQRKRNGDVFIESRATERYREEVPPPHVVGTRPTESKTEEIDPLLESLLAADAGEKITESDRPASGPPLKAAPIIGQSPEAEPAPEAPKPVSLPGLDRPVNAGDQIALAAVREQFDFCARLLAQGAYGDHYDTCLCKDTREAAPYRGRRGFYASALKKDASAGRLESAATITSSHLTGGAATVTAHWKSRPNDRGRDLTQTWRLEDGLWCRAP